MRLRRVWVDLRMGLCGVRLAAEPRNGSRGQGVRGPGAMHPACPALALHPFVAATFVHVPYYGVIATAAPLSRHMKVKKQTHALVE